MTDMLNNTKHTSPAWMINITGILAILTPLLPNLVATLPGSISDNTRSWINWIMQALTAVSAAITMLSKSKDNGNQ